MSTHQNLWIEKYRPKTLDDLCLSDTIRAKILDWGSEIPHILLIGNTGVGKTTLAQILVQNVLDCDYLYINASDENGIDTIRTKVTGFVQTKSFDGNIKVVILDEADGLTKDSQKCLRNLMESYSTTARFILTGNYKHRVIGALKSRCQSLTLTPNLKDTVRRCIQILLAEGITTTTEQKHQVVDLVKRFMPDIRECIGELSKNCVNGQLNIVDRVDNTKLCSSIFKGIQTKRSLDTRKYLIEHEDLFNGDWDQLLSDLLNYIYAQPIDDMTKKGMCIVIAEHLVHSTVVIDKEINVFACLLNLETV